MNKNLLIGIGAVVLIGIAAFLVNSSQKSSLQEALTEVSQPQEEASGLGKISGTLKDLLVRGTPMECTYAYAVEGLTTSGTLYLSGKKVRGNFETTQGDGQPIESGMVQDGEYVYIWSSQQPQGTKMKITDADLDETGSEGLAEEYDPMSFEEMNIDYSCKAWREDASFFAPPAEIEFLDLGQKMEEIGEAQCDVCDSLPEGEGKEQCLESLGCK